MTSSEVLTTLAVLGLAVLYFLAVRAARRREWHPRLLAALLVMVITDWPIERLSSFWAEHSILAAVLSTLLLVSLGYLAFEAAEATEQRSLDRSVTTAGMSGLVDHLVDVDMAVALLAGKRGPANLREPGPPLRWLRPEREAAQTAVAKVDGFEVPLRTGPASNDIDAITDVPWRRELIDQAVRRVIAGMRDWAALIGLSADGREVLKRMGDVRLRLLQLESKMRAGSPALTEFALQLRIHLQLFALALECQSSRRDQRRPGLVAVPAALSEADLVQLKAAVAGLLDDTTTIRQALHIVDRPARRCDESVMAGTARSSMEPSNV